MPTLKEKFLTWYEKTAIANHQASCEHTDWDMDIQIRVIKCRECGKTAWVREIVNLFPNK